MGSEESETRFEVVFPVAEIKVEQCLHLALNDFRPLDSAGSS